MEEEEEEETDWYCWDRVRHTKASPSDVSICDGSHSVGACCTALLSCLSLPCLIYISF